MGEIVEQTAAPKVAEPELPWWTHDMSVGNEALDDDHKTFFEFARIISEMNPAKDNILMLQSALNMLEDYVSGHFLREEKALRAVNYPHLEGHVQKHAAFRQHVMKIINECRAGNSARLPDLPSLISNWLSQHIMREDLRYKFWIKDKAVDNRPLAFLAVEADSRK
jgi:hemerythrin